MGQQLDLPNNTGNEQMVVVPAPRVRRQSRSSRRTANSVRDRVRLARGRRELVDRQPPDDLLVVDDQHPTPEVPDHIVGVTNLRGQIIPIVDLQRVLTPGAPATPSRHAVVVDVGGQLTGCLVDSVTRVVRLPQSEIQPADDVLDHENARSVDGFAKYEGTILIVLDASKIIGTL